MFSTLPGGAIRPALGPFARTGVLSLLPESSWAEGIQANGRFLAFNYLGDDIGTAGRESPAEGAVAGIQIEVLSGASPDNRRAIRGHGAEAGPGFRGVEIGAAGEPGLHRFSDRGQPRLRNVSIEIR